MINVNFRIWLINFSVLLYFISLLLTTQISYYPVAIMFYFSLVLCGFSGLLINRCKLSAKRIFVIVLIVLTGLMNLCLIGETSVKNQIFLFFYGIASISFTDDALSERTILVAIWINVIAVVCRFLMVGFWGQIYINASSNFVSVYLMYPTVMYYSIVEKKNRRVNIIPAVVVWGLSLLSRGRGGIISSTLFLMLLCLVQYRNFRLKKRLIIAIIGIIAAAAIIINLESILIKLNSSIVMEYFISRRGLRSSRFKIWEEYIMQAAVSIKNFLFGVNVSHISIGLEFESNPHNSFLSIHMYNGIFTLIVVLIMLIKNGYTGIKNRNFLYVVCMISMMMRAFTDRVFWPAYGTPILFYFMFYYNNKHLKCR